jgi:hypothetical protein
MRSLRVRFPLDALTAVPVGSVSLRSILPLQQRRYLAGVERTAETNHFGRSKLKAVEATT